MVETQSACFCSSGSTLKPCLMTFTPVGEESVLRLSFDIQDRNGYSLPPYQTPMVLPLKSEGFLMPVSARQVSSRPERLKVCEMLTSGTPFSREASRDGIQTTTTPAPPPAITRVAAPSVSPSVVAT